MDNANILNETKKPRIINIWMNSKETGESIEAMLNRMTRDHVLIEQVTAFQELGCGSATTKEITCSLQQMFVDTRQPYKVIAKGKNEIVIYKTNRKGKIKKVNLSSLTRFGYLKEGQRLIFCDRDSRKPYFNEYAFVEGDSIRYFDGNLYSLSHLAKKLRKKLRLTKKEQESQGPIFWRTESGDLISTLNDKLRHIL